MQAYMVQTSGRGLPADARTALRTFWRHPSPLMLAVLAIGFLAWRIALGGWTWWDALIPGILVAVWPLYEWLIHVFVLHDRPHRVGGRTLDFKVAKIHRDHHADPWDLPLVFIPLHVFPLTTPTLVIPALIFLPMPLATGAIATYAFLSLHYEWCHYLAHIDWTPPLAYWRRRVRLHRLHHFHHERLWWGVSTTAGDAVMRTGPDVKDAPRSSTTHDLLGHPRRL